MKLGSSSVESLNKTKRSLPRWFVSACSLQRKNRYAQWFRLIVSLVCSCSTKHRIWLTTLKSPIHLRSSCTVSNSPLRSNQCIIRKERNPFFGVSLVTMISGARNQRRSVLSQRLYDRMKSLFPDHRSDLVAASILLSNTYLSVGDEQRAQEVRINRIQQFGKKVQPGLSWTAVNGELVVTAVF